MNSICHKCQSQLKPGSHFCGKCGARVEESASTSLPNVSTRIATTPTPPPHIPLSPPKLTVMSQTTKGKIVGSVSGFIVGSICAYSLSVTVYKYDSMPLMATLLSLVGFTMVGKFLGGIIVKTQRVSVRSLIVGSICSLVALFAASVVGWIIINRVKDRNSSPLTGTFVTHGTPTGGDGQTLLTFHNDGTFLMESRDKFGDDKTTCYYRRYGRTIVDYSHPYNWFSDLTGPLDMPIEISNNGSTLYDGIHKATYTRQN